jgi:TonB family protein
MCPEVEARAERRRLVTLVGVSLLVHALALAAVSRLETPTPARARPMQLESLAWVATRAEQPPEPAVVQTPSQAPSPPQQKKKLTTPSKREPAPVQGGGVQGGTEGVKASEGVGERGDLPLATRPSLTPSSGFALQLGTGGLEADSPRGTTIRNGPGEAPDQASLNEYTGEVLTRKLNTDLQQEVGLAAVAVGNVPSHFKRYESAMRTALPKAKIDRTPMKAADLVRDVAGVMFNEGPSAEAARKVTDTPLGRSVQSQNVMSPNIEDQRFRESSLQLLAQGENLRERATRARLRTVLEVTTDATGALADVSIIERSGDPRFDESVVHFSRKVARTVPDNDDKMLGTSMWRTRWQFTWEPPDVRVRLLNAWRVAGEPSAQ